MTANMESKITDFSGTWKMKSSENFEELLKALGKSDALTNNNLLFIDLLISQNIRDFVCIHVLSHILPGYRLVKDLTLISY